MYYTLNDTATHGGVAAAAAILGAKWAAEIIYWLSSGARRFSQLEKHVVGINPRTLSARLDALEAAGIIVKKSRPRLPPRIEYVLTQKGKDLLPILQQMYQWGSKYPRQV